MRELLRNCFGQEMDDDDCDVLYDVGLCTKDYLDREINAGFPGRTETMKLPLFVAQIKSAVLMNGSRN